MMMKPIQRLESGTCKSIQASLVFPTLTSIILELVNRSLHAKPTSRIDIHVHLSPEWQVTCQDDAAGNAIDSLEHIAASSLQYLSFLGILDIQVGCRKHIQKGDDIIYSGKIDQAIARNHQPLSSIILRDFFRNIPVRRRALSNPGSIRSELETCRKQLAVLITPQHSVHVTLKIKTVDQVADRVILMAPKTVSLLSRYQELFAIGVTSPSFALPIATVGRVRNTCIEIKGFLVLSLLTSRAHQHIVLNGRLGDTKDYQCSFASTSQIEGIHEMFLQLLQASYIGKGQIDSTEFLPSGRHFAYFLDIRISCLEVFDRKEVDDLLRKTLVDFLQTHHLLPLDNSNSTSRPASDFREESPTKRVKSNDVVTCNHGENRPDRCFTLDRTGLLRDPTMEKKQKGQVGWLQDILFSWRKSLPTISPSEAQISTLQRLPDGRRLKAVSSHLLEKGQTIEKAALKRSRIIGQADAKFISILYEGETIILVDQHAAHERSRIEELLSQYVIDCVQGTCARSLTADGRAVQLSLAAHLSTPLRDADVRTSLAFWGFHIDCKIEKGLEARVQINAVPSVLCGKLGNHHNPASFVAELATSLEDPSVCHRLKCSQLESSLASKKDNVWLFALRHLPDPILDAFNSLACRGAIMFNDPLNFSQCQKLISQVSQTTFPFQCAHGRPSLAPICSTGTNLSAPIPSAIRWESLL